MLLLIYKYITKIFRKITQSKHVLTKTVVTKILNSIDTFYANSISVKSKSLYSRSYLDLI